MLCDIKFEAEKKPDYNAKWGVVFSHAWGERHNTWMDKLNTKFYGALTGEIDVIWHREKMTAESQSLRDKFMDYLKDKVACVYPGGHLLCGGSSISMCGSLTSDLDLCFALKTSDKPGVNSDYQSRSTAKSKINRFMIDRLNVALREFDEIEKIQSVDAKVPIVKFEINANVVDPNLLDQMVEFDINCNCVAGIYNAYLLGGFANFDDRFPKLAIILKKWAKNVKVVDNRGRFNSYLIVLLIVHYLQCGVDPPVLPNLMKLCPEDYDGNKEPWNLTTSVDGITLEKTNRMGVGALLCGFFRYYSKFDFSTYGILIKDSSIIKFDEHGRFHGCCNSRIFVEEPYDGLTVPKNIKQCSDFDHIMNEFIIAEHLMHQKNENGKQIPPKLEPLLSRKLPFDVATRESDVQRILTS